MKNWQIWGLALFGFLALSTGGKMAYDHYKQRGIRNNNPGNIRISSAEWQGKVSKEKNTDGAYEQFTSPEYGIRALAKTLVTYMTKHGLVTVAGIINRWAPPSENQTGAYAAAVAKALKVPVDAPLTMAALPALTKAIIQHENGVQPYPDALISKGVKMATG